MENLVLSDIRVLEFTHAIMGPSCGLVLADLGADVIKVEPAPDGDHTRTLQGFGKGYFSFFNRNKRSLCINLKTPEGHAIALDLLQTADVLVENFAPGTMERLGLGAETVMAHNPRLVYCSLKGFTEGPYSQRTALDEVVQMMSGLAYMTGPVGQPLRVGASVVDIMSGTFAALGVLAALRERDKTGKGQVVINGLFETAAYLMGQHMAFAATETELIPPMPGKARSWAIYQPFASADGHLIFLGVTSDKHWEAFCRVFNRLDLWADESLKSNTLRYRAYDRLIPDISAMLAQLPATDILAKCEEAGFPFAPVNHPEDLFDDPHLNQAGHLLPTILPDGTATRLPRLPLSGSIEAPLRYQPPQIGEHTDVILQEAGCDMVQIAAWREAQIIR
ncbi:MAG TPA: CoA transferase [Phototrophicaceae bacterium]|jgi:crotonobetainyl-CoA:carnitine CoA-transferase CaiB-like acyl-CoA transferase|nr:CoA transferase [Phototrophicaceae bacterium]